MPTKTSRARVIDIASRRTQTPSASRMPIVTQQRLRRGLELMREEHRISSELREFALQLEADLGAGAEIEAGDLIFDRDLKVARQGGSRLSDGATARG